ncbi:hypothetical protein VNPA142037_28690 [Pseudomonas aeruginosa]|nr:hypothetical protein VNPA120840_54100 [Pseudomonas aeruginosa]GLF05339.1 hypothetical protein VNPA120889_54960 [Pseudomonas aeruginosa]GLF45718.1 hypothetical protein VNPA141752_23720 [Pseudomonas aeruginosa]GLF65077.1 hypothetical protein VNPA142037_28690 [Pseudomonas aeruginosa]
MQRQTELHTGINGSKAGGWQASQFGTKFKCLMCEYVLELIALCATQDPTQNLECG